MTKFEKTVLLCLAMIIRIMARNIQPREERAAYREFVRSLEYEAMR